MRSPVRSVSVAEPRRIDDEWWRQRSVSRLYFSLLLEDRRMVAVYEGLADRRWREQSY
jgi:hypothetical protein